MTYQLTLPPDVERRLSEKATETGQDVVQLIEAAVVQFVGEGSGGLRNGNGAWSRDKDVRRCELIDKDIAGTITEAERRELTVLEREANDHFDAIAPPPIVNSPARRELAESYLD